MDVDARWYETFFDAEWLDFLSLPTEDRTERETAFVVETLKLPPGSRVLDLACGRGRIAVALARRGLRVTGLDLSRRSLALAAQAAADAGVELELVHADMRALAAEYEFDAVVSIWTSLGYFPDEDDDRRVLASVARALVSGGRFLLDTVNPIALAPRFVPEERTELGGGRTVVERREYDQLTGRIEASWMFSAPDKAPVEQRSSVRAYTPAELAQRLAEAGLGVVAAWGDFEGSALGQGPRTILLSRREG